MSGYIKLFQACCNYGFDGSYAPLRWKIDWRTTDVGPGYETLMRKHPVLYESGPLSNYLGMRCRWQGLSAPDVNFGFVIDRQTANAEQTLFSMNARFDWPEMLAWAQWDIFPAAFGIGPADGSYTIFLQTFNSGDGLFAPPTELQIQPWRVDDAL